MASSKNTADALFESIQDALERQDLSALQSSVERSAAQAADAIGDIARSVQAQLAEAPRLRAKRNMPSKHAPS